MLFSGHAENVHPLLIALGGSFGIAPPAATRVYFKYYECKECQGDAKHMVKVVYVPTVESEFGKDEMTLKFSDKQTESGLMTTKDFEDYI